MSNLLPRISVHTYLHFSLTHNIVVLARLLAAMKIKNPKPKSVANRLFQIYIQNEFICFSIDNSTIDWFLRCRRYVEKKVACVPMKPVARANGRDASTKHIKWKQLCCRCEYTKRATNTSTASLSFVHRLHNATANVPLRNAYATAMPSRCRK